MSYADKVFINMCRDIKMCIRDSFSGDTLFQTSVGRSDFPGGSASALVRSVKEKLLVLPEETHVYPGHMEETTIGYEKLHNPFI